MNRKSIVSILTTVLVSIFLFVVGCGEVGDDTEVESVVADNAKLCVNQDIEQDDLFKSNFAASRNADGSWTVKHVP